jgi:acyl-CoA synthetase (AMP-forming)/AMP-acid ligase II
MKSEVTSQSAPFSVETIALLAGQRAESVLWTNKNIAYTWADFGRNVARIRKLCIAGGVSRGELVVTPGAATFEALSWLFGAASAGAVVMPLREERGDELKSWQSFLEIGWQVVKGRMERMGQGIFSEQADRLLGVLRARRNPGLILATGGTTGTPKIVLHDLAALLATVSVKTGRAWRLLPLMRFDHIGGLDMAWRALAGGQVLIEPPVELTPEKVAAMIAYHRVEVMPATPSFLNLLLLSDAVRNHDLSSLRVVPYGAEPMPSGLLARLKETLPGVEFVQRFGTSETGALPVRGVGMELQLDVASGGYEWKIVEGELWVRSPARALGYLSCGGDQFSTDGWFRTGDLAEQSEKGAVRVLGRRDELINVGGEKVLPRGIEEVLLAHPQVADCRVSAAPNAVLGQVVVADVVWRGEEAGALAVKRALHEFAASSLPRCHLPAVVRLVPSIEATGNLKKTRRPTP